MAVQTGQQAYMQLIEKYWLLILPTVLAIPASAADCPVHLVTRGIRPLAPLRVPLLRNVQIRNVQGCTGAVEYRDVRGRPPGELVCPCAPY